MNTTTSHARTPASHSPAQPERPNQQTRFVTLSLLSQSLAMFGMRWTAREVTPQTALIKPVLFAAIDATVPADTDKAPILYTGTTRPPGRTELVAPAHQQPPQTGRLKNASDQRLLAGPVDVIAPATDLSFLLTLVHERRLSPDAFEPIREWLRTVSPLRGADELAYCLTTQFADTSHPLNTTHTPALDRDHGARWAALAATRALTPRPKPRPNGASENADK